MRITRPGGWTRRWRELGQSSLALLAALILAVTFLPATATAAAPMSMGGEEWARVYTVRPMDTLGSIALRFDVSQDALMRANNLSNPNRIYVGQQLIIPDYGGKPSYGMGGPECATYHTVRRSDTLSEIALYYGLDSYELARANGVYDLNEIYVGQRLCIPASKGMGGPKMDMPMQPERPMAKPEAKPEPMPMPMPKNDMPMGPDRSMGQPERNMGQPEPAMMREPERPMAPPRNDNLEPMYDMPNNDMPMRGEPMRDEPMRGEPMRPDGPGYDDMRDGPMRPDGMGPDSMGPQKGGSDEYWTGYYYADKYFGDFVLERKDIDVRFNWLTGGPFNDMPQDRFSVRWEKIEYFKTGNYRFFAVADDGVRVYVDDQLIIDGWKIQPATEYKGDIFLHEGRHKLVVEYYEEAEDAEIHVYWEPLRKR